MSIQHTVPGNISLTESPTSMDLPKSNLGGLRLPSGPSVITSEDTEAQAESERQTWFENTVNEEMDLPNGYLKVSVLIIRWDEKIDEFPNGHSQEIARLEETFRSRFNYDVYVKRLKTDKQPQHYLNYAIAKHALKFDGPHNLLIIYYTGHGALVDDEKKERRLELSATRSFDESKKDPYPATAFWHEAEGPLLSSVQGDVLVLLDCCYAGSAAKSGDKELKAYELITATGRDQLTQEPGKKSFTTALISSLEDLQTENKGENFPTTKLLEYINKKRSKTSAMLWDQLHRHKRHIRLAPLDKTPIQEKEMSYRSKGVEKASLNIRFSLHDDNLDQRQIKEFARQLPEACRTAKMPVRRIDWMKMERGRLNFSDLVLLAQSKLVRRVSKDSLVSPKSTRQVTLPSPSSLSEDSHSAKRRRTSSMRSSPQQRRSGTSPNRSKKPGLASQAPRSSIETMDLEENFE